MERIIIEYLSRPSRWIALLFTRFPGLAEHPGAVEWWRSLRPQAHRWDDRHRCVRLPLYTVDIRTFVELAVIAVTGLMTIVLFISGALLSLGKPMPGAILRIHQAAPLLALAFSALTIYLLVSSKS
jgi:hypothetical protein